MYVSSRPLVPTLTLASSSASPPSQDGEEWEMVALQQAKKEQIVNSEVKSRTDSEQ